MNRSLPAGMLMTVCAVTMTFAQESGEQKLKPGDVPRAVTAAAAKQYPKARVSGWSKELENGKVTYEASVVDGASKHDVVFALDGSLLAVEDAIQLSQLPAAVKSAIEGKYPNAVIRKAEKILRGEKVEYEVDLKNAPKKEITLNSVGQILKEE